MNLPKKSLLNVSVATILGVAAGNVIAAAPTIDLSASSPTAVAFAKEMPTSTTVLSGNSAGLLSFIVPAVPGYTVSTSNYYYVKVALTGGASFQTAPTISCNTGVGGSNFAANTGTVGSITVGGLGTAAVTFSLTAGVVLSSTGCVIDMPTVGISGLGNVNLSGTIEYRNGANGVVSAFTGPLITFQKGLIASVTTKAATGTVAANATIDVTTGSKKFTAATVFNTTTALVGSISYAATSNVYVSAGTLINAAGSGATYVSGNNGFSVTIAGPAVGNATSVFLNATATNACVTPVYSATPASGNSVTITGISSTDISGGLSVCLSFNGTTAITDGQITATIAKNTETISQNPDFSVSSNSLYSIPKNGAVKYINFLTNPAGFATYVRFTNPTAFDGNVLVTAINDDGAAGATVWTFPLAKGASQMYPVTYIQAQTGVATATTVPSGGLVGNKFRLVINADTSDLKVQALNVSKDNNSFGQLTDQ